MEHITRESILDREKDKLVERKTMLELEIALQQKLNPEEKSAKKPMSFDSTGRPMSYKDISRKEHIQLLETELESVDLRLETIAELSK